MLYFLIILFVPLLHLHLRCDAHHVDNIHYANISIDSSGRCAIAPGSLTVIRRDQLVHAVVRLAALDRLLAVVRPLRELIGPVHPVDTRIYVVLVACSDLQDTGNPVIARLLPLLHWVVVVDGLLPLDAKVIRDVDKAFAKVLDPINCVIERTSMLV